MTTGVYKRTEKTRKKMSLAHKGWSSMLGKRHTEETKEKIRNSRKGRPSGMLGKKQPLFTKEHRRKLSEAHKGTKSHFWKGGITPINLKIRMSLEYRLWRESVFKRDNYICIWCGLKSGNGKTVILNADHIKPFSLFPELRFAIDNGRTLCVDCHKKTNTWGRNKKLVLK